MSGRPPLPTTPLTARSPGTVIASSPGVPGAGLTAETAVSPVTPSKQVSFSEALSSSQGRKKKGLPGALDTGKAAPSCIDPAKCFIMRIPDEVLVYIFANLDPSDLKLSSGVCRKWSQVISDDNSWRSAFENYFRSLPLRRITEGSWRREYLTRTGLLKEWGRSRQSVLFEPRIGRVEQTFVDMEDGKMYAGSLEKGMIAICNPTTGKVEKEAIFCGDEDREAMQISVLKIDRYRIVVGHLTGQITLITNFKDRMDYSVKRFRDVHDGPVSCIAWSPVLVGALVSGGVDGNVRVWDVPSSTCIRTLVGTGRKITYVAFDTQNHVLASTDDGQVLVWDLNVSSIISRTLPSGSSTAGPPHSVLQPSRVFMNSGGAPIKNLIYDPDSQSCLIVFNARSQAGIQRRKIKDGSVMTKFNNAHVSPVVCSVWDKLVSGATERNSSILVTGDQLGTICIWEIPESAGYADKELVPLRSIPAAHAFELAHIYLDPFKMVSVDVRGIIRVWDLMTTVCIRALNSKRCRNREEGENEPLVNAQTVNLIWAGPYQVIVCLGNSIKSWNFDPFQSLHLGNRKKKGRSVSRNHHHHGGNPARASLRMQARSPRQQFLSEMREDIQQVAEEREYERQAGQQNAAALARMNGSLQDPRSGMTEDELVSYAMMISMEEQQQQQQGRGIPPAGPGMPSRSGSSLGQSPRSASAWTTPLTPSRSSPRHGSSYNSQRCNSWHSRQAHNDWDDDEEEDETQNDLETSNLYSPRHHHGRPLELDVDWDSSAAELSTSGGRRRLFYGMSTSGGSRSTTATSGPDNLHSRYASSAAGILLRSPGLYPQRASASQYGGGQPQGNVSTVSPNNWDEELQYVLEMSLHDQ